MKKFWKILAVNLIMLSLLGVFLNVFSVSASYLYYKLFVNLRPDPKCSLPNFPDRDQAVAIYSDLRNLQSDYRAFVGWKRLPYVGRTTTIDSNGHRWHTPNPHNRDGATAVAFFGGSTIWGTGAVDAGSIPAVFDHLRDDCVVRNFGESSYNNRQGLDRLISLLNIGEKFDIVVFYDGVNEISACRAGANLNAHSQELLIRDKMRQNRINERLFLKLFEPTTTFVSKVTSRIHRISDSDYICDDDPDRATAVAEIMLANWRHARTIAQAHGMEFFAFLQPVAYLGTPQTEHLVLDTQIGEQYRAVYAVLQDRIRAMSQDWIFDLTDAFDCDDYIYTDFAHVTENGNKIIASRISEILEERSLLNQIQSPR